jgi:hypothetical protein
MSTIPYPTGLWSGSASQRYEHEAAIISCGRPDGRATVVPLRTCSLGLGLLLKILKDCEIKPEQLQDLL